VKILSNRGQCDDNDEEIECVERPSEEAGGDRRAMIASIDGARIEIAYCG